LVDRIINESNYQKAAQAESSKYGKPLWEIDAGVPFIGSPVHEEMTKASFNISNIENRPFDYTRDESFIHGVFWNDDPEDLLCPQCSILNLRKLDNRWGITYANRFLAAKKKVQAERNGDSLPIFKIGDGLLERSHFGDLQFLHGMASKDGETAGETQDKILAWAEFTYKVAIGEIPQKTKLNQIPIERVRKLFVGAPKLENLTIEQIFRRNVFAKRAAIGSLLHMIQDSYASGHADRVVLDYTTTNGNRVFKRSIIREFHCYTNQDENLHKQDDRWPDGLDKLHPIDELNPITTGARILQFMYANDRSGAPWADVEKYLREVVFSISDRNTPAGPGEKYRKK